MPADANRPRYHLLPPANWINDPNGPVFHDGVYHVFYQHNPHAPEWGSIHWGHASSRNLARWRHEPIALAPDAGVGEEHCFSGCTVIADDGTPTIFYTSIGPDRRAHDSAVHCVATGSPDLRRWTQHAGTPILTPDCHGSLDVKEWRDPFVWKQDGVWYMVLGGLVRDRGAVLLYRSPDLRAWEFLRVLFEDPGEPSGRSWECPVLVPLGDTWLLIVSAYTCVRWFTGEFDARSATFTPRREGVLDLGFYCYAPNGCRAPDGRTLLWGWIRGIAGDGWSGALTIPRVVALDHAGRVCVAPAIELETLRVNHRAHGSIELAPNATQVVEPALSPSSELRMLPAATAPVELRLLSEREPWRLAWNPAAGTLSVGDLSGAYAPHATGRAPELRLFLDRCVAEIFVNGACLTAPVPGTDGRPYRLELAAGDEIVRIDTLETWDRADGWA